jgi:hypothetical protein
VAQRPTKFYYPLEIFNLFYGMENALAGADWVAVDAVQGEPSSG